ncbi:MAG: rRNA maturation RNase YbeY [Rhodothermaceae bacterium]|nr:rRNA maturation RNase YbeY [Rhodothermaceae bacterium]
MMRMETPPNLWPDLTTDAPEGEVSVTVAHQELEFDPNLIEHLVSRVVEGEDQCIRQLEITLMSAEELRELNRSWRNADYDTDVLSFSLSDGNALDGEIYVSLDFARTHCQTYGATYTEEVCRYIVHGMLHLLGYEDDTARGARTMRSKEDQYLRSAGVIGI